MGGLREQLEDTTRCYSQSVLPLHVSELWCQCQYRVNGAGVFVFLFFFFTRFVFVFVSALVTKLHMF